MKSPKICCKTRLDSIVSAEIDSKKPFSSGRPTQGLKSLKKAQMANVLQFLDPIGKIKTSNLKNTFVQRAPIVPGQNLSRHVSQAFKENLDNAEDFVRAVVHATASGRQGIEKVLGKLDSVSATQAILVARKLDDLLKPQNIDDALNKSNSVDRKISRQEGENLNHLRIAVFEILANQLSKIDASRSGRNEFFDELLDQTTDPVRIKNSDLDPTLVSNRLNTLAKNVPSLLRYDRTNAFDALWEKLDGLLPAGRRQLLTVLATSLHALPEIDRSSRFDALLEQVKKLEPVQQDEAVAALARGLPYLPNGSRIMAFYALLKQISHLALQKQFDELPSERATSLIAALIRTLPSLSGDAAEVFFTTLRRLIRYTSSLSATEKSSLLADLAGCLSALPENRRGKAFDKLWDQITSLTPVEVRNDSLTTLAKNLKHLPADECLDAFRKVAAQICALPKKMQAAAVGALAEQLAHVPKELRLEAFENLLGWISLLDPTRLSWQGELPSTLSKARGEALTNAARALSALPEKQRDSAFNQLLKLSHALHATDQAAFLASLMLQPDLSPDQYNVVLNKFSANVRKELFESNVDTITAYPKLFEHDKDKLKKLLYYIFKQDIIESTCLPDKVVADDFERFIRATGEHMPSVQGELLLAITSSLDQYKANKTITNEIYSILEEIEKIGNERVIAKNLAELALHISRSDDPIFAAIKILQLSKRLPTENRIEIMKAIAKSGYELEHSNKKNLLGILRSEVNLNEFKSLEKQALLKTIEEMMARVARSENEG